MKSSKGSAFERQICKELSLWWTQKERSPREDCFWRTAGSGARAKVRGRRGQSTYGQSGDICATDPSASVFTDLLTIEIKRGYSKSTFADLLDRPDNAARQFYEQCFEQVIESAEQANSFGWMLITKRDKRLPLVCMPKWVYKALGLFHHHHNNKVVKLEVPIRIGEKDQLNVVYIMTFGEWLNSVTPDIIRKAYDEFGFEEK